MKLAVKDELEGDWSKSWLLFYENMLLFHDFLFICRFSVELLSPSLSTVIILIEAASTEKSNKFFQYLFNWGQKIIENKL